MRITPGAPPVLGIEKWSVPRHVADVTANSIGDGVFTSQTILPGKLMIDQQVNWTSDSPIDAMILLRINRGYRDWVISNPNAIQIRDRWTYKIGVGPQTPIVPDPSSVLQAQHGAALDLSSNSVAQPIAGLMWDFQDMHITEDWIGPVPAGQTIAVRYRCYMWTPPPWSNNANNNIPIHECRVRNARIQFMAFPTQDTAVVTG
jgi:hypothetical protein